MKWQIRTRLRYRGYTIRIIKLNLIVFSAIESKGDKALYHLVYLHIICIYMLYIHNIEALYINCKKISLKSIESWKSGDLDELCAEDDISQLSTPNCNVPYKSIIYDDT